MNAISKKFHYGLPISAHNLIVLVLIMLVMLSSVGCSGQMPSNYAAPIVNEVVAMPGSAVIYGMGQCLQGAPGTSILMSAETGNTIFAWSYNGWKSAGFFAINMKTMKIVDVAYILRQSGQLANSASVSDLMKTMVGMGYAKVAASALPAEFVTQVTAFKNTIQHSVNMTIILVPTQTLTEQQALQDWINAAEKGEPLLIQQ